jgi:RNA polymerase sigma-70 factor, ECF subfamily
LHPSETQLRAENATPQDLDLVRAVVQRDRKATASFVAAHADAVFSYLSRRLFPRQEVVEDLTQEVFLNALESLPAFKGDASIRAWLIGIARHKVQDYYRQRLREVALDEFELEPSVEPFDVDWIQEERLADKVRSVLSGLPDAYRHVLLWRYWEKCSAAEMARRIGKTEKAVERLLARSREHFRRRWNSE